jgi:hypothetical protein
MDASSFEVGADRVAVQGEQMSQIVQDSSAFWIFVPCPATKQSYLAFNQQIKTPQI